jgi:hypothetical protein
LIVGSSPCLAQFAGPAVLSRGEAPAMMTSLAVRFRPFMQIAGSYDTGLAGLTLDGNAQLATRVSTGIRTIWGVSGVHQGKFTMIGLDYRGSITHYSRAITYGSSIARNNSYDSLNLGQSLMLGVTHRLAKHATLTLSQSAGMFTRDFGLLGLPQTVPFDPAGTYTPTTDFFDNRTLYSTSQAGLSLQKSTRLSFSAGGGLYLVRRRSESLFGTSGASANGDAQYRLTRTTTVGGAYSFQHFTSSRASATSDVHSAYGTFARRLSRRGEFSGFAGLMRIETKFLQRFPVDPVIAQLLGITDSTQIVHRIILTSRLEGRFSWLFPSGVAFLSAGRGITPGNGVFLTSLENRYNVGYVYTGLRRWAFHAQVAYRQATSIQNQVGSYTTASAQTAVSRTLSHWGLNVVGTFAVRQYSSNSFSGYNRTIQQATIGLGFSPGEVPLRIW